MPSEAPSISPLLVSLLRETRQDQLPERVSIDMLPGKYVKAVAQNVHKVSRRHPKNKVWLICRRCRRKGRYDVGLVLIDSAAKSSNQNEASDLTASAEHIQCTGYFRCWHCDAADWELPAQFYLFILTHLITQHLLVHKRHPRVKVGLLSLFDGFVFQWATQGELHLLQQIQTKGQDAYIWNRLGNLYWAGGRPELAMAAFEKSLRLDSGQVESCFSVAGMLYDLGEIEEGEKYFQKALLHGRHYKRLEPEALKQVLTFSLVNLVAVHRRDPENIRFPANSPLGGEFPENATLVTKELTLNPKKPETFYPLAEMYMGVALSEGHSEH